MSSIFLLQFEMNQMYKRSPKLLLSDTMLEFKGKVLPIRHSPACNHCEWVEWPLGPFGRFSSLHTKLHNNQWYIYSIPFVVVLLPDMIWWVNLDGKDRNERSGGCPLSFSDAPYWTQHVQTQKREKPWFCSICLKNFLISINNLNKKVSNLSYHVQHTCELQLK